MSSAASDHNVTYAVNLINPTTATINLIAFYNAVKLDSAKRVSIVDTGLLQFVQHSHDYNANPANRDADGTIMPRPTNSRPILPVGANAATISVHNINLVEYQTLAVGIVLGGWLETSWAVNRGNDCRYPACRARSRVDIDGLPSVACAKRINAPSEGIEMTAFAVASLDIIASDTSHSDLTGRFPIASITGNQYLFISTMDGYIHAEPMTSCHI